MNTPVALADVGLITRCYRRLGYCLRWLGFVAFFATAPICVLLIVLFQLPLIRLLKLDRPVVVAWQRSILVILGTRLIIRGRPSRKPSLWVSNHVSWLDAPLLGGISYVRFLAKADVANWPVIGFLVKSVGTVFIHRGKGLTTELNRVMAEEHLHEASIAFFAESTTTTGDRLSYFFPRLFGAAQLAKVPVQPVAIRYGKSLTGIDSGPFIDDMDFFKHLFGLIKHPPMFIEVMFLEPFPVTGRDESASRTRAAIGSALALTANEQQRDDIDFPQLFGELKKMFYPERFRDKED